MKIAITGATGFIGSHLTQHFVSQGWNVLGLCRRPPHREQNPGVEFVPYELGEPVPQDGLTGCGALIHCAHVLYSPRQRDADKLNIEGSRQLFRAAERAGVGKILYLSSLSAHPEVQSHYARSKLEVESLLNPERDAILRLGLVLGPGGFAGRLQAVLARTRIVPLIDAGRQPVYAIHMEDLCRVVKSLILTADSGILQIGHPCKLTVATLSRTLARVMRRRVLFLPFPFRLLHPLVSLAGRFGAELPVTSENLLGLRGARPLDLVEDVRRLGVAIRSFDELLESGCLRGVDPPTAGSLVPVAAIPASKRGGDPGLCAAGDGLAERRSVSAALPGSGGGTGRTCLCGAGCCLRVAVASAAQSCGKGAVACGIVLNRLRYLTAR